MDQKNLLDPNGNFMCSSAFFTIRTNTTGQQSQLTPHVPRYDTYKTYATDYDHYDWDSFVENNEIAKKLGLTTLSIEQKKNDQVWIERFKQDGYSDEDIEKILQYRKDHPNEHITVLKYGDQLFFSTN